MRLAALLSIPALVAVTGCTTSQTSSTSGFEGAEKAVAQTVADLADAGQKREPADICGAVVAETLREEIVAAGSTCNDEMRKAIEDVDDFELEVTDVRITGATAQADVKSTDREREVTRRFEFVREGGKWRISSFG